jgi:hypothetical protein
MNTALVVSVIMLAVLCFVIQISGVIASSESKLLQQQQQQQNHSFIAKLTGDNIIPPLNTNATGIAKFDARVLTITTIMNYTMN